MKVGQLITLSTEEYSDYGYAGPYAVKREFTFREILPKVLGQPITEEYKQEHGPDDVRKYLEDNGYIEILDCDEIHLGCYGGIEIKDSYMDM